MTVTIDTIRREIIRLDPKLSPDDDSYKAAVILLASGVVVGPNIKRLAKFTRYPRLKVAKFSKRLREQGVWRGAKVHGDWFGENGGISFWLDVGVATGMFNVVQEVP